MLKRSWKKKQTKNPKESKSILITFFKLGFSLECTKQFVSSCAEVYDLF